MIGGNGEKKTNLADLADSFGNDPYKHEARCGQTL
jgi:hypothetical protein